MRRVLFADSFYYFAILNPKDEAHARAFAYSTSHNDPIVTTAWVLTELADGLAATNHRKAFAKVVARIQAEPNNVIVSATQELMIRGALLYDSRPDKKWSLTDCVSFVVMGDHGLTLALTGDHHFEQAGFRALLKKTD